MLPIGVLILVVIGFFAYQYWKYKAQDFGAPYIPMEPEVVEAALRLAKMDEDDVLYDLGSGDGRIPIMAALQYKAKAVGIEIDKFRYIYSKFQSLLLGLKDKVTFLQKDLFSVDLSEATVVTMFLLQETNDELVEKLLRELRPGTRIVSAAFDLPNWRPLAVDEVHSTPYGPLYLYEVGTSNP